MVRTALAARHNPRIQRGPHRDVLRRARLFCLFCGCRRLGKCVNWRGACCASSSLQEAPLHVRMIDASSVSLARRGGDGMVWSGLCASSY